jgi:YD repeat-containing protein
MKQMKLFCTPKTKRNIFLIFCFWWIHSAAIAATAQCVFWANQGEIVAMNSAICDPATGVCEMQAGRVWFTAENVPPHNTYACINSASAHKIFGFPMACNAMGYSTKSEEFLDGNGDPVSLNICINKKGEWTEITSIRNSFLACPTGYRLALRNSGDGSIVSTGICTKFMECPLNPALLLVDKACFTPPPPPIPLQACSINNPVVPGSGEKLHSETDLTLAGAHPLSFSRFYRSRYAVLPKDMVSKGLGAMWMHNYQANLKISAIQITATRPDSSYALFQPSGTGWLANPLSNQNGKDTLTPVLDRGTIAGYSYKVFDTDAIELYDLTGKLISITDRNGWRTSMTYSNASTPVSVAPAAGLLIQVTNHFGRSLKFTYNDSKQLIKVTDPIGYAVQYAYAEDHPTFDMLVRVLRQNGSSRGYQYTDKSKKLPWALTGIYDELKNQYATYGYDDKGRVISESKIGNVDIARISYSDAAGDYTTTVQNLNAIGNVLSQTSIGFTAVGGRYQPTGSSAPSALCGGYAQTTTYDTQGNKLTELTHDAKFITYTYDAKSRQLSRTERTGSAYGAITYKATTAYHPTFNLPTLTTEPNKRVAISYDAKGNVLGFVDYTTNDPRGALGLNASVISSQSTGWTYNAKQLPATARYTETKSGVTSSASTFSFSYNAQGNLTQFTQSIAGGALETGKLTSYNANGAFLAGISTSGERVAHSYTPRGQLATTSIFTPAVPATLATATKPATPFIPAKTALANYTYDAIGQSKQVSYPNGDTLVYTYSPAHKLLGIKWNGIEQYTPVAGISGNLAALAGYSGITNPELAYKLGVNSNTLDMLDAAPKALTAASNAAAFKAVELAKEAVLGKRVQAAVPLIIWGVVELGGASQAVLGIGAGIGLAAIVDNLTSPKVGDKSRICLPGKDPDDCQKLYDAYRASSKKAKNLGGCNGTMSQADKNLRRPLWEEAAKTRESHHNKCFDGGDSGHQTQVDQLWKAAANCK